MGALTEHTEDALFEGQIKLLQPARGLGYRVNVDALLLGAFAVDDDRVAGLAVDLGAGVGAVGLTLFHLRGAARVEFVEKNLRLADLCARNLAANGLAAQGTVHVGDLEASLAKIAPGLVHAAALVVANPPYVSPARDGRFDRTGQVDRLAARHGDLSPFLRATVEAFGRRARACFVYPAHALVEMLGQARQACLEPKRLRFVHGKAGRPARIALVELVSGKGGGLVVEPALVEMDETGRPTAELADLLSRRPATDRE